MWEILDAAKIPHQQIKGSSWVDSIDFMTKTLFNMSHSLKTNIDLFINPRPETIEFALQLKSERLRRAQEESRLHDLDRARIAARRAFSSKQYKKVIGLLTPFADILSEADRKRMHLSKKYAKNI